MHAQGEQTLGRARDIQVLIRFRHVLRRQLRVHVLLFVTMLVLIGLGVIIASFGDARALVFAQCVLVVGAAWLLFWALNWRCPECRGFLGLFNRGIKTCPRCGVQLQ